MPASMKHLTDKKVRYNSLLARWTDGLYYAAALTKCDKTNKRYRVCFEDGSEIWVSNRDLHIQLSFDQASDDEDIVCCICDEGNSEPPNEIILCDVCQQGYHQRCHIPPVDSSKLDESDDTKDHKDWFCATCSYILNQTNRAKSSSVAPQQQQQQQQQKQKQQQQQQKQQPAQMKQTKVDTPQSSRPKQSTTSETVPVTSASKSATPAPIVPKQIPKVKQTAVSQQQPQQQLQTQSYPQPKSHPLPEPQPQAQIQLPAKPQPQQPQTHPQPKSQPQPQAQPKPQSQPPPQSQPLPQSQPQLHSQPQPKPQSQQTAIKSTIGAIKPSASAQQRSAPYYPLSTQVRSVAASSSTAALASMTASSALVVGSIAGRSKQDLVKQSNRSTQRQSHNNEINIIEPNVSPPKHAVRKSSVNYVVSSPIRQSALPTATRSVPSPTMASNGQNNKELIATTLSTTIISPPKTSSVSVLTCPIKQSPDKSVKQSDRWEKVGSTSNIIIDNRSTVNESTNNGSTQPSISTNVSSSGVVNTNIKVISSSNSSEESKQTSESNVNSTSEYQHISTSMSPQSEITGSLPSTGQQSVINVPRTDLSAKNDSDAKSVNKTDTNTIIVGVGGSPSK